MSLMEILIIAGTAMWLIIFAIVVALAILSGTLR